jgi:phosphatidylinositol glycan class V
MLNFLGTLSYVLSARARFTAAPNIAAAVAWTVAAGLCFGLSTTVRSNGILSGIVFALDAIAMILRPSPLFQDFKALALFAATICAGILVGIGFAAPQIVAYVEYCTSGNSRPWCSRLVPSIYSWVQDHYWEVGFLRYWTLNNLPLFLLAGPMLVIMLCTGYIGLFKSRVAASACSRSQNVKGLQFEETVFSHVTPRLALPQLILAATAATSFHVQIINRISSGYPVWYILLAIAMSTSSTGWGKPTAQKRIPTSAKSGLLLQQKHLGWIVRGMVMYAIVQGGLYASFLPPA